VRNFDNLMLSSVELFCLTVEKGNFTEAAYAASLTPAAVSRSINRIEKRLGVQLFQRSTRKINLTAEGMEYYETCKQAIESLNNIEIKLTQSQATLAGTIKISLPTTYGHYRVLPLLSEFKRLHPLVNFKIHVGNNNIDFIREKFDISIRARELKDSNFIARPLEYANLIVVATPHYLQENGIPINIHDLSKHECIQFLLPSTGQQVPWLFEVNNKIVQVNTQGSFMCTDDILATITLAKNSAGLLQTYKFLVEKDLENGSLKEVLSQFSQSSRPFSIIYPSNKHLPKRTRVFIDFLISKLQK
jgi:DNA-binding transcriptional LysR family regulator